MVLNYYCPDLISAHIRAIEIVKNFKTMPN